MKVGDYKKKFLKLSRAKRQEAIDLLAEGLEANVKWSKSERHHVEQLRLWCIENLE